MFRLLLALLMCIAADRAGAVAVVVPIDRGDRAPFIESERIVADIDGMIARTRVELVWRNPESRPAEAHFLVPVPKEAQVTRMEIVLGGKRLEAEALGEAEARRIYEDIVRRTRDPGLLEYIDGRTFRARLFPIPANGTFPVTLEFVQPLRREGSLHAWEIDDFAGAAPNVQRSLEVSVKAEGALGALYSTTHAIAPDWSPDRRSARLALPAGTEPIGRFALLIAQPDTGLAIHSLAHCVAGKGTFVLFVSPPSGEAKAMPKDVVFVLDTSGSMAEDGKWEKALAALRQGIAGLGPEDRFNIVAFATSVEQYRDAMSPADAAAIADAAAWIGARRSRGGTNIEGALRRAASLLGGDGPALRQIVFMTDGQPTIGKTDPVQVLHALPPAGGARVFPVGFGFDVNAPLLDEMAARSGTFSTYVAPKQDIELAVAALLDAISASVLSDIEVSVSGAGSRELYPASFAALYAGRDLLVAGEYSGGGAATVTVSAKQNGADFRRTYGIDLPAATGNATAPVRAIFANRKVGYLLEEIRRNGAAQELIDEVKALALEFGIVTPYTSFLAAPDEEYALSAPASSLPAPRQLGRADRAERRKAQASSKAMESSAGADAVAFSEAVQELKNAEAVRPTTPAIVARERRREAVVQGRLFQLDASGTWVQQGATPPPAPRRVAYLSDEYFKLLAEHPAERPQILLGEKVLLELGGEWVFVEG